jgi:hypothetical protein
LLVQAKNNSGACPAADPQKEDGKMKSVTCFCGIVMRYVAMLMVVGLWAGGLASEKPAAQTAQALDEALQQSAQALGSDQFEDNDTWDTAAPIAPGTYLYLEALDEDWYQLCLLPGDILQVQLWFDSALGDLDVYIFDPTGALVGYSNSTTNYESALLTASLEGRYLIQVVGWRGATNSRYDMRISLTGGDWGEENDTWDTAYSISCNQVYYNLRCLDPDWYRLDLSAGSSLDVNIYFANALGDLDLYVYDPRGALVASSASTGDGEFTHIESVALPGRYLIAVVGYNNAYNVYDMQVACSLPDDAFEPNDTWDTAASISPGTYNDLQCLDDDWYRLWLSPGDSILDVSIQFTNALGDLDLYVYDPTGAIVGYSTTTSDNKAVHLSGITMSGRYLIQVTGYGGATNSYDLQISVSRQRDDSFEENDTWDTAKSVSCNTRYDDLHCLDPDWYRISLDVGDFIAIATYFSDAAGDLDLYLYDPQGYLVASSESQDDNEFVEFSADIAGRWLIEVVGYEGAQNDYDMEIGCISDDRYEENDRFSDAKTLDDGWYYNLVCADDDWFRVWKPSAHYVIFYIEFANDYGDLGIDLYDEDGTYWDTSDGSADDEWFTIVGGSGAYYYFRVFNNDAGANVYDIYVEVGWSAASAASAADTPGSASSGEAPLPVILKAGPTTPAP